MRGVGVSVRVSYDTKSRKKGFIMKKLLINLFFVSSIASAHNLRYQSAEHIFAGDEVTLSGLTDTKLTLDNGLQLSYGEIVSMPDFYGDPNHQISSEPTFEQRKQRFEKVFSDFSHYDPHYFNKFWPIVQNERKLIVTGLKKNNDITKIYHQIENEENKGLALATNYRYLTLAITCFDHFNDDAIYAYQAGHAVAIQSALSGYKIKSEQDPITRNFCATQSNYTQCIKDAATHALMLAYEQNAYANHFLSDRFAAGHMRTPYRALFTTRPIPVIGGLSGEIMHNEDNRIGVIVTNSTGQYWVAYGDDYYFSHSNKTEREQLRNTLQTSADEIFTAFQTGVDPDPLSQKIIGLIPKPISPGENVIIDSIKKIQTMPLYRVINNSVWQRMDVNNVYDDQWTAWWSTLLTFLTYHSPENKVSMKWQLILKKTHEKSFLEKLKLND